MRENYKDFEKREKEDMLKIAGFSLWEKLTVRKVNISRGTLQRAYKSKKDAKFEGDVIDYLCYESLREFATTIVMNTQFVDSINKMFSYADVFLDVNKNISVPIYRLLIKDENYLVKAFAWLDIGTDHELYIKTKKLLLKKMKKYITKQLNTQLLKSNKSDKLKSS